MHICLHTNVFRGKLFAHVRPWSRYICSECLQKLMWAESTRLVQA